jgi:hypothetical protein
MHSMVLSCHSCNGNIMLLAIMAMQVTTRMRQVKNHLTSCLLVMLSWGLTGIFVHS